MTEVWSKIDRLVSSEGTVEKYVFTKDNAVAEAVLYRYPTYAERTVICCSTQSGCPVGCRFCGAGDYFVRSLNTEEIVEQSVHLLKTVEAETGTIPTEIARLQIMFMSMGEPFLNIKRVNAAMEELHRLYPNAVLLISSSGPRTDYESFMELAAKMSSIGLQFSIHETTDEKRNLLMPFKDKLTLAEIALKGEEFFKRTGRKAFFNYCVHDANNTPEDITRLRSLFNPEMWNATISVICERDETLKAAHERQEELTDAFMEKLEEAGFNCRRFNPAGQSDIAGGCGMLWETQKWVKDNPDRARPSVGFGLPIRHSPLPFITLN
jgi:23S rRNA (adenine2503-C2)-methyltransferase